MKLQDFVAVQILKIAKEVGYKPTNIAGESESEKKAIRIKNNNALAHVVDELKAPFSRERVNVLLQDKKIPDYEIAVVVGDRYANYYHSGFILGENGKDSDIKNTSIDNAVRFLLKKGVIKD